MITRRLRPLRRAFSLLEVILSSSILIIGISGLLVGVTVALNVHEHQRKVARALLIAERRMESLLVVFPGTPDVDAGRHPAEGFELFDELGRPGGNKFRVHYTITGRGADGADGGFTVEVTVAWDERFGERTLSLETERNR